MTIVHESQRKDDFIVEIRKEKFEDLYTAYDTYTVYVIEEDGDVGYVKKKSARYRSLEAARRTYRRYIREIKGGNYEEI